MYEINRKIIKTTTFAIFACKPITIIVLNVESLMHWYAEKKSLWEG